MTDYDAPRHAVAVDVEQDTLIDLQTRRTEQRTGVADIGEAEVSLSSYVTSLDLLADDGDDLAMPIEPRRADEFLCTRCFLVLHRSRLSAKSGRQAVCRECL